MAEDIVPGRLIGWHVVEVGIRQAWPFLTLADPVSGREARIFIDAPVLVTPDDEALGSDDPSLLPALDRIDMMTWTRRVIGDDLELQLEDQVVSIVGRDDEQTGATPWRIVLQGAG